MHRHRVAIIGLGAMGQRMLANMREFHAGRDDGFSAVYAWDPDQAACDDTARHYAELTITDSAEEAIAHADVDCVYIASPPQHHAQHARTAFAAGKAVWCEKPLGVDIEDSKALVKVAEGSGQLNIVNFSLASAIATTELEQRLQRGDLGTIASIHLSLHFSKWPRVWQVSAHEWLTRKFAGGFTREVTSHWIYLTERLFGPCKLVSKFCQYPDGDAAETHLQAMLEVNGIPFTISSSSGGVGPDVVEYTVRGERLGFRIQDFNVPLVSSGDQWTRIRADVSDPRAAGYEAQLDNAACALAGEPHTMPNFRDALRVQQVIEALLAG